VKRIDSPYTFETSRGARKKREEVRGQASRSFLFPNLLFESRLNMRKRERLPGIIHGTLSLMKTATSIWQGGKKDGIKTQNPSAR